MQSLPQDVVEKVVIFAGANINDIGRFAQTCGAVSKAASAPHIWQQLAGIKYGEDLATVSGPLYEANWKALMIDDNRRGALPTLTTPIICNFARNERNYFFCCIVQAVKWDRRASVIKVYVDVRGERSLRHPSQSSITPLENEFRYRGRSFLHGQSTPVSRGATLRPSRFVSEITPIPGHFKGYLEFPVNETGNLPAGVYSFCYANENIHYWADYLPITLFSIAHQGTGLAEAFRVDHAMSPSVCYTADQSPFANDTPEIERKRWEEHVPREVMNRGSDWYV